MFHDRLLMGQYPTGRVFEYDGRAISDKPGWPPGMKGVSDSAREAQTMTIYGGELFVGVWPWAELWRYNTDSQGWSFVRRMFNHPELSQKITHPYDVENQEGSVGNQWGQRVTGLVTSGRHLFVSTSAKWPCEWDAEKFPFLAPDKWKSYGRVYRLTMPGHLGATTSWTNGPTILEFLIRGDRISITQDGQLLAADSLPEDVARSLHDHPEFDDMSWGQGIYGPFGGNSIDGRVLYGP